MSDKTIEIQEKTHINNVKNLSMTLGFLEMMEHKLLETASTKEEKEYLKQTIEELVIKLETNLKYTIREGTRSMQKEVM
ncbi:MAG: hypothetical protein ACOC1O_00305 [bacterium]